MKCGCESSKEVNYHPEQGGITGRVLAWIGMCSTVTVAICKFLHLPATQYLEICLITVLGVPALLVLFFLLVYLMKYMVTGELD